MPRISWANVGERYYESGIDRGVLYPESGPGVAWPGITAVRESPSGGSPKPYYINGFKYLNVASSEEFAGTIDAFFAPPEFGECDGTVAISNGLYMAQQRRKSFGMSYRTKIGNDVDGVHHAYKIHLVYDALVAPSSRTFAAIGDAVSPSTFSWEFSTLPPLIPGRKPTSHFVIDSRMTPAPLLLDVEELLYGSDTETSRLPSVSELIAIFDGYTP